MSRENVEVVRRVYAALQVGGLGAAFDLVDREIEWHTSPNLPDAGIYRGREEVTGFLAEQWDIVWGGAPVMDLEAVYEKDGEVVVFVRMRGRGSHTGIELDVRIAHVLTVRAGRVVRGRVFPDRSEALEAVGLAE